MPKTHDFGSKPAFSRRIRQVGAGALVALMLASQAPAMAAITVRPGELQGTVDVKALGTVESRAGEAKIDFLKRVGQVLDVYTTATDNEACGIIGARQGISEAEPGKWIVPLVTQESHIACVPVVTLPEGASYTGEIIHSHPDLEQRRFRASEADVKLMKGLHARRVHRGQWVSSPSSGAGAEMFSSHDFAAGSGYLVARGQLFHQNGPRAIVNHGQVWPQGADPKVLVGLGNYLPTVQPGVATMVDFQALGVSVVDDGIRMASVGPATPGRRGP